MSKFTHSATLVRGKTYTILIPNAKDPRQPTELSFKRGEPKDVTAAQKTYLDKSAVDTISVRNGEESVNETRAKFTFVTLAADDASVADDDTVAARTRAPAT